MPDYDPSQFAPRPVWNPATGKWEDPNKANRTINRRPTIEAEIAERQRRGYSLSDISLAPHAIPQGAAGPEKYQSPEEWKKAQSTFQSVQGALGASTGKQAATEALRRSDLNKALRQGQISTATAGKAAMITERMNQEGKRTQAANEDQLRNMSTQPDVTPFTIVPQKNLPSRASLLSQMEAAQPQVIALQQQTQKNASELMGKQVKMQTVSQFLPALSHEQLGGVQSKSQYVGFRGGPGGGKSKALISAIFNNLLNQGLSSDEAARLAKNTIFLSQTKSAVSRMRTNMEGAEQMIPGWDEKARSEQMMTLGRFAMSLLNRNQSSGGSILQQMGAGDYKPLYQGSGENIEEEMAKREHEQVLKRVLTQHGYNTRINNVGQLAQTIAEIKGTSRETFEAAYKRGKSLQDQNSQRQVIPSEQALYLYQNELHRTKQYDINDVPGMLLKASTKKNVQFPRFGMIANDESQDTPPIYGQLFQKLLGPSGRLITAGDPSQQAIRRPWDIDQTMKSAGAKIHELSINFRTGRHNVSSLNPLLATQAMADQPKSPFQAAFKEHDQPIRTHVEENFPAMHRAMFGNWMKDMGLTPAMIAKNMQSGVHPFSSPDAGSLLPGDAPFIFQRDEEGRGAFLKEMRSTLSKHMDEAMLDRFMQENISSEPPTASNVMSARAYTVGQARSHEFPEIHGDVTPQGLWPPEGHIGQIYTMQSRAINQQHLYYSKKNMPKGTQHDLATSFFGGQEVPHGWDQLMQAGTENLVDQQGMAVADLPEAMQYAYNSPHAMNLGTSPERPTEDPEMVKQFVEETLFANKFYSPPVDSGSGLLQGSKDDQFAADMRTYGFNAEMLSGQTKRSVISQSKMEMAARAAQDMIMNGPGVVSRGAATFNSEGVWQTKRMGRSEIESVPSPKEFMDRIHQMAGPIPARLMKDDIEREASSEFPEIDNIQMKPWAGKEQSQEAGDTTQVRQWMGHALAIPGFRNVPEIMGRLNDLLTHPKVLQSITGPLGKLAKSDPKLAQLQKRINLGRLDGHEAEKIKNRIARLIGLGAKITQTQQVQLSALQSKMKKVGGEPLHRIISRVVTPTLTGTNKPNPLYHAGFADLLHGAAAKQLPWQHLDPDFVGSLGGRARQFEREGDTSKRRFWGEAAGKFEAFSSQVHPDGSPLTKEMLAHAAPHERALLERIFESKHGGDILPYNHPDVESRVSQFTYQRGLVNRGMVSPENMAAMKLSRANSRRAPGETEFANLYMALQGGLSEGSGSGIEDPMNTLARGGGRFASLGAGTRLDSMIQRLTELSDPAGRVLTSAERAGFAEQLGQAQYVKSELSSPTNWRDWAHTLRAASLASTGKNLHDPKPLEEGKPNDPVRELFRHRDQHVKNARSLEGLTGLITPLKEATAHLQKTGSLRRSHVDEILRAFGYDPADKNLTALRKLEEKKGFSSRGGQDPDLPMAKLIGQFPDQMKDMREQLTRVPIIQGSQHYTYMGGEPGYADIKKAQQGIPSGIMGTLHPLPKTDETGPEEEFGLSKNVQFHMSRDMFSKSDLGVFNPEKAKRLPEHVANMDYAPLMQFEGMHQGSHVSFPVHPEQLALADTSGLEQEKGIQDLFKRARWTGLRWKEQDQNKKQIEVLRRSADAKHRKEHPLFTPRQLANPRGYASSFGVDPRTLPPAYRSHIGGQINSPSKVLAAAQVAQHSQGQMARGLVGMQQPVPEPMPSYRGYQLGGDLNEAAIDSIIRSQQKKELEANTAETPEFGPVDPNLQPMLPGFGGGGGNLPPRPPSVPTPEPENDPSRMFSALSSPELERAQPFLAHPRFNQLYKTFETGRLFGRQVTWQGHLEDEHAFNLRHPELHKSDLELTSGLLGKSVPPPPPDASTMAPRQRQESSGLRQRMMVQHASGLAQARDRKNDPLLATIGQHIPAQVPLAPSQGGIPPHDMAQLLTHLRSGKQSSDIALAKQYGKAPMQYLGSISGNQKPLPEIAAVAPGARGSWDEDSYGFPAEAPPDDLSMGDEEMFEFHQALGQMDAFESPAKKATPAPVSPTPIPAPASAGPAYQLSHLPKLMRSQRRTLIRGGQIHPFEEGKPGIGVGGTNPEQRDVLNAPDRRMIVQGGPGTGKTETMIMKIADLIAKGHVDPSRIMAFSGMHSGVSELNTRMSKFLQPLLPHGEEHKLPAARTLHSLAHQVLFQRGKPSPALGGIGLGWIKGVMGNPSEEELARQTPETQEKLRDQQRQFLHGAIKQNFPKAKWLPSTPDELDRVMGDIKKYKSSRTGEDPLYDKMIKKGLGDISHGKKFTHAGALAVYEQSVAQTGNIDFEDLITYGSSALGRLGSEAIPQGVEGTQLLAYDEAQDANRENLGFVSNLVSALGPETHAVVGLDPLQSLFQGAGSLPGEHIVPAIQQMLGGAGHIQLRGNYRSSMKDVALSNSILQMHAMSGKKGLSPLQVPYSQKLGSEPSFMLRKSQPELYKKMFSSMLAHAGVSPKTMRENILAGEHPFKGVDWNQPDKIRPGEMPALFMMKAQRSLFEHIAPSIIQGLDPAGKIDPEMAKKAFGQMYRPGLPGKAASDEEQTIFANKLAFRGLTVGQSRGLSFENPHMDASPVGEWRRPGEKAEESYLHNLGVMVSRTKEGGRSFIGAASTPFSGDQMKDFVQTQGKHYRETSPESHNRGSVWYGEPGSDPLSVHPRNEFDTHEGQPVAHYFGEIMGLQKKQVDDWKAMKNSPAQAAVPAQLVSQEAVAASPPRKQDLAKTALSDLQSRAPSGRSAQIESLLAKTVASPHASDPSQHAMVGQLHTEFAKLGGSASWSDFMKAKAPEIENLAGPQSPVTKLAQTMAASPDKYAPGSTAISAKDVTVNAAANSKITVAGGAQVDVIRASTPPLASMAAVGKGASPVSSTIAKNTPIEDLPLSGATPVTRISRNPFASTGGIPSTSTTTVAQVTGGAPSGTSVGASTVGGPSSKGGIGSLVIHPGASVGAINVYGGGPTTGGGGDGGDKEPPKTTLAKFSDGLTNTGRTFARIGQEMQYFGQLFNDVTQKALEQGSDYRLASGTFKASGATADRGFYDFANPASGISQMQTNSLPMFSKTDIAQNLQNVAGMVGGQLPPSGTSTSIMQLAALTGADPTQLTSQIGYISGSMGQGMTATPAIEGYTGSLYHGQVNATNLAPTLQAVSSALPSMQGLTFGQGNNLGAFYGLMNAAQGGGMTAANMPDVSDLTNSLAQVGTAPNLNQQAALNQLFPGQLTGGAQLAQFQQQQVGMSEQAGELGLQQQFNVPGLQMQIGNANVAMQQANVDLGQIQQQQGYAQLGLSQQELGSSQANLDYQRDQHDYQQASLNYQKQQLNYSEAQLGYSQQQFQYSQAQYSQAQLQQQYAQASFTQQQYVQTQEYGPIGADTGRQSYFDFMRNQQAAGYNPLSAETGTQFKPSAPQGIQNMQFYAGIENQRQMSILSRSPLLSDAAFQQQQKYLNEQEAFYKEQLDLTNEQRTFDVTWGQKMLDSQQKLLDLQGPLLTTQKKLLDMQQPMLDTQKSLLNQQQGLLNTEGHLLDLQQGILDTQKGMLVYTQEALDQQGKILGIQQTQVGLTAQMNDYQNAQLKLQQAYLPAQLGALLAVQTAMEQQINGQGPVNGTNPTPQQIIKQLSLIQNPTQQQDIMRNLGLPPNQVNTLQTILNGMKKAGGYDAAMSGVSPADKSIQAQVNNLIKSGAFAGQTNQAAQSDTSLLLGGTAAQWTKFTQAFDTANKYAEQTANAASSINDYIKGWGTFFSMAGPAIVGIGMLLQGLGLGGQALNFFTSGGASAAAGGAASWVTQTAAPAVASAASTTASAISLALTTAAPIIIPLVIAAAGTAIITFALKWLGDQASNINQQNFNNPKNATSNLPSWLQWLPGKTASPQVVASAQSKQDAYRASHGGKDMPMPDESPLAKGTLLGDAWSGIKTGVGNAWNWLTGGNNKAEASPAPANPKGHDFGAQPNAPVIPTPPSVSPWSTAYKAIVGVFAPLGKTFQGYWNAVASGSDWLRTYIKGKISDSWNAIVTKFSPLGKFFSNLWVDVQNVWKSAPGWLHDRFQDAWNRVTGVWSPLGKIFQGFWKDVQNVFVGAPKWFQGEWQIAWNNVTNIWSPIGKTFQGYWNDIMGGVNWLRTNISNTWNSIKVDTENIFHNMINGIIDHLNDGISGVEGFINFFGQGLDKIAGAFHVSDPIPQNNHLGRIPHYALGTDSHPGGPMVVGEKGPELLFAPKGSTVVPADLTEALLSMFKGKVPGYAGGVGDITASIIDWVTGGAKSLLDNVVSTLHITAPNLGPMKDISSGVFNSLEKWALSWISSILPSFGGSGSQGSPGTLTGVPGNVASWIQSAMALTHVPASWLADLEIIAMHESGGNPNSINLWDSNALAGHPSQGLFQTIPGTFAAHALPGHGNILNPIDNAASAIGYIEGRYGDVFHVPGIVSMSHGGPYVGYSGGGILSEPVVGTGLSTGTRYSFAEAAPEAIVPLSKLSIALKSLPKSGSSAVSTQPTTISSNSGQSIQIKSLIGTATININTNGTKIADTEKDELMSQIMDLFSDALKQLNT